MPAIRLLSTVIVEGGETEVQALFVVYPSSYLHQSYLHFIQIPIKLEA
jgi:hypothetical protein